MFVTFAAFGNYVVQYVLDLPRDAEGARSLDQFVAAHADELAGFIVEPLVQGAGGMRFHDAQTLKRLRALADRFKLLLIFDEIFTGFGRTGQMFASEAADVVPDIITLSKALTGGTLPLAATVAIGKVFVKFLRELYQASYFYHAGDVHPSEAPSENVEERISDAAAAVLADQQSKGREVEQGT